MDLILLGFLTLLSFALLAIGFFKVNAPFLLVGSIFLVLTSALLYTEGYDIPYDSKDLIGRDVLTYDSNHLVQTVDTNYFRVNANTSPTAKGLGLSGLIMGALMAFFSIGALVSHSESQKQKNSF